ncbi:MAG: transporter, partial [Phycisphaerales bacterium JB050]
MRIIWSGCSVRGPLCVLVGLVLLLATPRLADAQEAINTPAATQPGAGNFVNTWKLRFTHYNGTPAGDDGSADEIRLEGLLAYGFTGDFSMSLRAPLVARSVSGAPTIDGETGVGDLTLEFKYRFWQDDFGAVDTIRASVFAGAELPTGNSSLGSESVDPHVGAVVTYINGRHGLNQALSWKFNTDGADEVWRAGDA